LPLPSLFRLLHRLLHLLLLLHHRLMSLLDLLRLPSPLQRKRRLLL
jgi:hypothetical protein